MSFTLINCLQAQTGWYFQHPKSEGNILQSCYFKNNYKGLAVGEKVTILKNTNGGFDWGKISCLITTDLYGVSYISADNAIGKSELILKANYVGNTWLVQSVSVYLNLNAVNFCNSNLGIIVGDIGKILRTADGGDTFTTQTCGTTSILNAVYIIDENNVTVVGNYGTILWNADGGITWDYQASPVNQQFNSVAFSNPNIGLMTILPSTGNYLSTPL